MKEVLSSKPRRVITSAAAAGLSVIALAACGSKPAVRDHGSDRIGACPPGFIHKGDKPVRSLPRAEQDFGSAVVQLSAKLPIDQAGEPITAFSDGATHVDVAIWNVADAVFYTEDAKYGLDGTKRFATDQPNKIDDPSEQFCSQSSSDYLSPHARNVVGALQALRIDVASLTG